MRNAPKKVKPRFAKPSSLAKPPSLKALKPAQTLTSEARHAPTIVERRVRYPPPAKDSVRTSHSAGQMQRAALPEAGNRAGVWNFLRESTLEDGGYHLAGGAPGAGTGQSSRPVGAAGLTASRACI